MSAVPFISGRRLPDDFWDRLSLHLHPQSMSLVLQTSKAVRAAINARTYWETMAILAWNRMMPDFDDVWGFESQVRECMLRKDIDRWGAIMSQLEIIGDGYKTEGYVTEDPRVVCYNEMIDEGGGHEWIESAAYDFWEEVRELNSQYDSESELDTDPESD